MEHADFQRADLPSTGRSTPGGKMVQEQREKHVYVAYDTLPAVQQRARRGNGEELETEGIVASGTAMVADSGQTVTPRRQQQTGRIHTSHQQLGSTEAPGTLDAGARTWKNLDAAVYAEWDAPSTRLPGHLVTRDHSP